MLPYILKICGFKNSTVYTFYSMYQKYTFLVKLYICGLTSRLYIRYKDKLSIDVLAYVPTLTNDPPSAAVCLRSYNRYYRSGPSSTGNNGGYRNIRTSGRFTVHRYGLLRFGGVDPRDPPLDLWDGIPPGMHQQS